MERSKTMKKLFTLLILTLLVLSFSCSGDGSGGAGGTGGSKDSADTSSQSDVSAGSATDTPPQEVRENPSAEAEMVRLMKEAGFKKVYAAIEGGEALLRFEAAEISPDLPDLMLALAYRAAETGTALNLVKVQYYLSGQPYSELIMPVENYRAWTEGGIDDESFDASLIFNDLRSPEARLADELAPLDMEMMELNFTADGAEIDLFYWAETPETFLEDLVLAGMYTLNVLPWADKLRFNYLWDGENSLSVELKTEDLLAVLGREKDPALLEKSMRVERRGDYFAARRLVEQGEGENAGLAFSYRRDDFDQVDRSLWFVWEEKTYRTVYEKLRTENGNLVIEATETDRNPFVFSKAFPLIPDSLIRVKRRVRVHYANDYLNASFSLQQTDHDGLEPSRDANRSGLIGNQYLNFQYDKGRYPITKGLLVSTPGYKENGQFVALEENVFDRWIEEEFEYNTANGEAVYRIDGREFPLQSVKADQPYFRVYMNAYGWYTGHKVEVDYIEIEEIPLN